MYIKIYGIERSGTNYIQQLLKKNTNAKQVFSNCLGWKHGKIFLNKESCPDITIPKKCHVLIIVKNPYSWYQSIKKYRPKTYNFYWWYNKYNDIYTHYINWNPEEAEKIWDKKLIVKYESLLSNPEKMIKGICDRFGLQMNKTFTNPQKVEMSPHFEQDKKKFYLREDDFGVNKETIKEINKIVNKKIFETFKYKQL